MKAFSKKIMGCFLTFMMVSSASAQYMMEQYIPIGQSRGVSGITAFEGSVLSVDQQTQEAKVQVNSEIYTVRMNSKSNSFGQINFWIDNTPNGQPNIVGSIHDVGVGSYVEVHFADNSRPPFYNAIWVKILGAKP